MTAARTSGLPSACAAGATSAGDRVASAPPVRKQLERTTCPARDSHDFIAREQTMRIGQTIRTCSLSVAAASMLFAGAAMAQTSSSDSGQNWQLTGANARLVHTINAKSVR